MANLRSGGPSFFPPDRRLRTGLNRVVRAPLVCAPFLAKTFSSHVNVNRKYGRFLSLCLYLNKFVLLSGLTHKEKICLRIRAKPLRENAKSLLPVDVPRSKMCLLKLSIFYLPAT